MTEQHSLWERLKAGAGEFPGTERERKVLDYVVHRIREGADLPEVLREEYVQRNLSPDEADRLVDATPELVRAARERMEEAFSSGELDRRSHG